MFCVLKHIQKVGQSPGYFQLADGRSPHKFPGPPRGVWEYLFEFN